jgi:hypothetical protein
LLEYLFVLVIISSISFCKEPIYSTQDFSAIYTGIILAFCCRLAVAVFTLFITSVSSGFLAIVSSACFIISQALSSNAFVIQVHSIVELYDFKNHSFAILSTVFFSATNASATNQCLSKTQLFVRFFSSNL